MAQIEKLSGSSGPAMNGQRSRERCFAAENISASNQTPPHASQRSYRHTRRTFSRYNSSGASAPFLAQYLGETSFLPGHPLSARREMTLAYIGADMLPELLAETRRPRRIDRKF